MDCFTSIFLKECIEPINTTRDYLQLLEKGQTLLKKTQWLCLTDVLSHLSKPLLPTWHAREIFLSPTQGTLSRGIIPYF